MALARQPKTAEALDNSIRGNLALAGPDEEARAAGELRERKRAAGDEEAAGGAKQEGSLRERVMAARRALDIKERAKEKVKEKVMTPAKMGTKWLLKWAWFNLIPSFGLTLIYINMHVFLRWIFPSLFCKLGEEWVPVKTGEHSATNIAGTAFGIVEIMGLLLIDIILFIIIFGVLSLIVMIINFMGAGLWEKMKMMWESFMALGWGGIKALVDLF